MTPSLLKEESLFHRRVGTWPHGVTTWKPGEVSQRGILKPLCRFEQKSGACLMLDGLDRTHEGPDRLRWLRRTCGKGIARRENPHRYRKIKAAGMSRKSGTLVVSEVEVLLYEYGIRGKPPAPVPGGLGTV